MELSDEMRELYDEARRVLRYGDEEDVAEFLARTMTPAEAAAISAAFTVEKVLDNG